MKNLAKTINSFRDSKVPEYRKFYLDSIKNVVEIGERLLALSGDEEIEKNLKKLKEIVSDYKIYPLIDKDENLQD